MSPRSRQRANHKNQPTGSMPLFLSQDAGAVKTGFVKKTFQFRPNSARSHLRRIVRIDLRMEIPRVKLFRVSDARKGRVLFGRQFLSLRERSLVPGSLAPAFIPEVFYLPLSETFRFALALVPRICSLYQMRGEQYFKKPWQSIPANCRLFRF